MTPRLSLIVLSLFAFAGVASADTLTFQQGDGGAYSTTDATTMTEVGGDYGSHIVLSVVTRDAETLLRFPDLVGPNSGQIPPGSTINSATLTLTQYPAFDSHSPDIHEVFAPWEENTAAGYIFYAQAGTLVGPIVGTLVIVDFYLPASGDVTSLVQGWADGNANQGVMLRSRPPDYDPAGWYITQFFSDDAVEPSYRPKLSVEFTPPAVAAESTTWGKVKALYR